MSTLVPEASVRTSSPDLIHSSEDELFNSTYKGAHETVETVPLNRNGLGNEYDSEGGTMETLPIHHAHPNSQNTRLTQPTQIIHRSPEMSSPNLKTTVQVAASSPIPTPAPARSSFLASAMAPAGTAFRRPYAPPAPPRPTINIDSDDDGPQYRGGSSDDDHSDLRRHDIKTSTFQRKSNASTDKVPESPHAEGGSKDFKAIISSAAYRAPPAVKRSADVMANAYGNAAKRPRQSGPSRALPVQQQKEPDMELEDINDPNLRQKVRRMNATVTSATVRECFKALKFKKWNYEDAVDYCLFLTEKAEQEKQKMGIAIDLTGSEDELMPTPAALRKPVAPPVKQQARVPQKSIQEKWSSTQNVRKLAPKKLDVFETPPPAKPAMRRLVQGRKNRSPPPLDEDPRLQTKKTVHIVDDDSDEVDSGVHSGTEDTSFQSRLLTFFNTCTAADLADTASIEPSTAEHFVSKRPFRSIDAVAKVQNPNLKPPKGNRKAAPFGERIADKVEMMLTAYEAVDFLVRKCENIAKPLAAEMKTWGIDIYGTQQGEVDLVSLHDSQRSSHDSGIGTPVSDDDREALRKIGARKYVGQPAMMNSEMQMKDYQIVGINWLSMLYQKGFSCILADDMGLGKTCQVIAFLAHLYEIGEKGPHLIVVPAATLENWLQEFQRFCPRLSVRPYYASDKERVGLRYELNEERDDVNVIVTTYTLAKGKDDNPWLREYGFTSTIFDEGHLLKNADSLQAKKLIRIKSKFRLLLTGTPLQNNLKELISLLGFLMPTIFHDKKEELRSIFTHNVKAMDANHKALLSAQRIARARSMLTPFILRRKKDQVLKDLPKKERRVEYCEMTPEQTELYNRELQRAYSIRERRARGENVFNETANILIRLRQAAIHPFFFRRLHPDSQLPIIAKQCVKCDLWRESNPGLIVTELAAYSDFEIQHLCDNKPPLQRFVFTNNEWLASGKVQKMLELLRTYMAEGHRTLIFSQFTTMLDILEIVLNHEEISYFRMDGTTKVSERQDLIDEFSAPDNHTPVFMLSTRTGGAGINLAKANRVIVFDSGFNPQEDIQAENRAHRIGQVKEVEVVRLVTRGTVEEQIHAMGLTKLRLDQEVAGDAENGEDVKEIEQKGLKQVEDMFFKKLDEEPAEKTKVEAAAKVKPEAKAEDEKTVDEESDLTDLEDLIKPETEDVKDVKGEASLDLPSRARVKKGTTSKPSSRTSSTTSARGRKTRGK